MAGVTGAKRGPICGQKFSGVFSRPGLLRLQNKHIKREVKNEKKKTLAGSKSNAKTKLKNRQVKQVPLNQIERQYYTKRAGLPIIYFKKKKGIDESTGV